MAAARMCRLRASKSAASYPGQGPNWRRFGPCAAYPNNRRRILCICKGYLFSSSRRDTGFQADPIGLPGVLGTTSPYLGQFLGWLTTACCRRRSFGGPVRLRLRQLKRQRWRFIEIGAQVVWLYRAMICSQHPALYQCGDPVHLVLPIIRYRPEPGADGAWWVWDSPRARYAARTIRFAYLGSDRPPPAQRGLWVAASGQCGVTGCAKPLELHGAPPPDHQSVGGLRCEIVAGLGDPVAHGPRRFPPPQSPFAPARAVEPETRYAPDGSAAYRALGELGYGPSAPSCFGSGSTAQPCLHGAPGRLTGQRWCWDVIMALVQPDHLDAYLDESPCSVSTGAHPAHAGCCSTACCSKRFRAASDVWGCRNRTRGATTTPPSPSCAKRLPSILSAASLPMALPALAAATVGTTTL